MLTCATDNTARIWRSNRNDQNVLLFSHILRQQMVDPATYSSLSTTPTNSSTQSRNKPFSSEITWSKFFYQDKFILLVSILLHVLATKTATTYCFFFL
jgi:hypothetical protein